MKAGYRRKKGNGGWMEGRKDIEGRWERSTLKEGRKEGWTLKEGRKNGRIIKKKKEGCLNFE
jgi:hypothetical protein